MEVGVAVQHVISHSGKPAVAVSREMGMSQNYVTNIITRGSIPRLDTFARICEACGYEVVLQGHGERVVLDVEYDGR